MENLFDKYINLAYSIVHKKYSFYPEKEDIIQIALLGLWKASNTFKPELNIKFMTYASNMIRHDITDYIRSQSKHCYADIGDENNFGSCEMDLSNLKFELLIRNLPDFEKSLIRDYVYGFTQKELAIKYGISQTTVSQKLKKIREKLNSRY